MASPVSTIVTRDSQPTLWPRLSIHKEAKKVQQGGSRATTYSGHYGTSVTVQISPNELRSLRARAARTDELIAENKRLKGSTKTAESEARKLQRQLFRFKEVQKELLSLQSRLNKLRKLKLLRETQAEAAVAKCSTQLRIYTAQIRDHERYAEQCEALYHRALEIIQEHIVRSGEALPTISVFKRECNLCKEKQPIFLFGVRVLPSGDLGFVPYCHECRRKKSTQLRKLQKMTIGEVAQELVDRSPKVAREIVDRFEEEVEAELEATTNS